MDLLSEVGEVEAAFASALEEDEGGWGLVVEAESRRLIRSEPCTFLCSFDFMAELFAFTVCIVGKC